MTELQDNCCPATPENRVADPIFYQLLARQSVQDGEQLCDSVGAPSATVNHFQRLAELFAILHTVFSNPEVQRTGMAFMDTLESTLTKEVDSGRRR